MEVKVKEPLDDNIVTIDLERSLGLALGAINSYEISKDDISDYNRIFSEVIKNSNLENHKVSVMFDENEDLVQYYEIDEKSGNYKLKEQYKEQFKDYLEKLKLDLISWFIIKNNIQDEDEIKRLLGETEEKFSKKKVLK